jgi:hypothetical protein
MDCPNLRARTRAPMPATIAYAKVTYAFRCFHIRCWNGPKTTISRCIFALLILAGPFRLNASDIISGPRAVGAFQTDDDNQCHVVVALKNGTIMDITRDCLAGPAATNLIAKLPKPVALTGYYAPSDHFRHVIVGLANGDLYDIRFKAAIPPAAIRLTNLADYGPIRSLSAWTDVKNNKNIALLTTLNSAPTLSIYQAQAGKPGEVILVKSYPGIPIFDLAGAYIYADSTNKVQLAVGNIGAPTSMRMVSWSVNTTPTPTTIQFQFEGTNTPWVTNFPGSGSPPESIVSIGSNSGYPSTYAPWSSEVGLVFLDKANQIKVFGFNNGGGVIAPGPFSIPGQDIGQSIAGPFYSGFLSNQPPSIQIVVATVSGALFILSATQPGNAQNTPSWVFTSIGSF